MVFGTEQRGGNKIQHRGPALGDPLGRQRIETDNFLHHRGAAEVENDHGDHRRNKVHRIHRAELALRDSLLQHFTDSNENRLDIVLDELVEMRRRPIPRVHHLALHQPRINLIRRDEIEVRADVGQDLLARRQVAVEDAEDRRSQPGERFIEYRSVERLFVLEVVIEERLVDVGFAGDGVCTGSGDAVLCELEGRRLQNGCAALLRLAARTHAAMKGMTVMEKPGHEIPVRWENLINQLVRLYTKQRDAKNYLFSCSNTPAKDFRLQVFSVNFSWFEFLRLSSCPKGTSS